MDNLTRRGFVQGVIGAAALLGVGGVARYAFVYEPALLRPPGGQDARRFIELCIKCNRCISVCPESAISVVELNDGLVNMRTPTMAFTDGFCTFCDGEYKCIAQCPTGALQPFDHDVDKIGIAVVDPSNCIAFAQLGGCGICAESCPYDAISLDELLCPVVDTERCNGCGVCEFMCPSGSYRSYSNSGQRGINVEPLEEVTK